MRRWIILLLLGLLLPTAAQEDTPTGRVNAGPLNVRAAPTIESTIITQVNFGEDYVVLAQLVDASWFQIRLDAETTGWVAGRYLTVATPAPVVAAPAFTPAPYRVAITADVNVRSGPSTTFKIVDGLVAGTEVTLTGRDGRGNWVQIRQDSGATGWMIAGVLPEGINLEGLPVPPETLRVAILQGLFWQVEATARVQFGPLLSTPLLGFVEAGQFVRILGRDGVGEWVKILYDGAEGWVQAAVFAQENDVLLLPEVNFK